MKSVRVSSKSALHVTPGAASGVAVPKALQAPGLQQVQNSSERDPCLSMPGKNPLVSSGSLQPQLGQLVRAHNHPADRDCLMLFGVVLVMAPILAQDGKARLMQLGTEQALHISLPATLSLTFSVYFLI